MVKKILSGNEAVAKGALKAGLGFCGAYPITPSSEVMNVLLDKVEFVQAEDEIAAINMCVGASLAGKKVLTATSGPGFSLMQETLGLAYKFETPIVVVDSQRVGPSTGMPTVASQGDILQAKHGSHGDYVSVVFYPNSVEELYKYTIIAMNAAEELSGPVILLSDATLSRMYETVELAKVKVVKRKLKPLGSLKRHFTGLTSVGDVANTKDASVYQKWYKKRKEKILSVVKRYNFYEYVGNKKSDTLLIAYGITSRVVYELQKDYAIFRPIRLFPILGELDKIAKNYKNIVVVEMNDGQYRGEVQGFLKRDVHGVSLLGGELSLDKIKNGLKRCN